MDLSTFNSLEPAAAVDVVRPCADVPVWIDRIVAGRPYGDVDALLSFAGAAASGWDAADLDSALAHHPRIGDRHAGPGTESAMSSAEQAGITGDQAAIAEGNRAYEQRFGRIFLIRAAGRTSAEVLEQLDARLHNEADTETAVAAGQLREIALLRLEGIFAP